MTGVSEEIRRRGGVRTAADLVEQAAEPHAAASAVASIRRWWQARGRPDCPAATRLLIA
nr:hypothetical protein [Streptomyces sp. CRN 30]